MRRHPIDLAAISAIVFGALCLCMAGCRGGHLPPPAPSTPDQSSSDPESDLPSASADGLIKVVAPPTTPIRVALPLSEGERSSERPHRILAAVQGDARVVIVFHTLGISAIWLDAGGNELSTAHIGSLVQESYPCGVVSGKHGVSVVAQEHLVGERIGLAGYDIDPADQTMTRHELAVPEPWRLRNGGTRPCYAWDSGAGSLVAVVLSNPANNVGIARYELAALTGSWSGDSPAVEPMFSAATSSDRTRSLLAFARRATRTRKANSAIFEIAPEDATLAKELLEVEGQPALPAWGLDAWLKGQVHPGVLVARADVTKDAHPQESLVWHSAAPGSHEREVAKLSAGAWRSPARLIGFLREPRLALMPEAPANHPLRVFALLDPAQPDRPELVLDSVVDVSVAHWTSLGGAWVFVASLVQVSSAPAEERFEIELRWLAE